MLQGFADHTGASDVWLLDPEGEVVVGGISARPTIVDAGWVVWVR